jgi:hypothetical protein
MLHRNASQDFPNQVRKLQGDIASERRKSEQLLSEVTLLKGAPDEVSLKEQLLDATSMSEVPT